MVACLIVLKRSAVTRLALKRGACVSRAPRLAALWVFPAGGCLHVAIYVIFDTGSGFVCRLCHASAMDACLVRLYRQLEYSRLAVLALGTKLAAQL